MNNQPLVSIIIPTYNRAHLIGETLDSVLAQTYTNWECIVVDDGSTDNTDQLMATYCAKDARFQYHHRPADRLPGGNAARNYGFEVSKGEYVNWLDSDDLLVANKIKIQINEMVCHNYEIHVGLGTMFSEISSLQTNNYWSVLEKFDKDVYEDLINQKLRWPIGVILFKRTCVNDIFWNDNLQGAQEWLFNIMIAINTDSNKIYYLNKNLLFIRENNNSITRSRNKIKRFKNYLYARIILLEYLINYDKSLFNKFFNVIYAQSLKYIRCLIVNNEFQYIKKIGDLSLQYSLKKYVFFYFGVLIFKCFEREYFLHKVKYV